KPLAGTDVNRFRNAADHGRQLGHATRCGGAGLDPLGRLEQSAERSAHALVLEQHRNEAGVEVSILRNSVPIEDVMRVLQIHGLTAKDALENRLLHLPDLRPALVGGNSQHFWMLQPNEIDVGVIIDLYELKTPH